MYGTDDRMLSDLRDTALHELQHQIQAREGFARGASGSDPYYWVRTGEVEARDAAERSFLDDAERRRIPPHLARQFGERLPLDSVLPWAPETSRVYGHASSFGVGRSAPSLASLREDMSLASSSPPIAALSDAERDKKSKKPTKAEREAEAERKKLVDGLLKGMADGKGPWGAAPADMGVYGEDWL
jgi:hypothetical protein